MSDQGQKLAEQLQSAIKNSRIDPSLAELLVNAIKSVIGEQSVDVRSISVEELSKRYSDLSKLLGDQEQKIQGVIDVEQRKLELLGEEASDLKRKIEFMVTQDELDEEELKSARKRYKEIKKIVKLQEDYERGAAKGEAAAERLLQATLGVSKGWENLSAKGLMKGLHKGIAETFQIQNVLAAIATKMFEVMNQMDKARADLFSRAQISRDELKVGEAAAAMGALGTNMEGVAAQAAATLKENFLSFSELTTGDDSQLEALTAGIGTLSKLGVSMQTSAQIIGTQVKAMGQTPEQAQDLLFNLTGVAQALGRPPKEMLEDFKRAQPILARFEAGMQQKIFKDTAFMASKLGIEVNELLTMSESMDTFEGAAKTMQAINTAFGAPIISSMALLAAKSPMEKQKVIADSLRNAGRSVEDLHWRMQKGLAADLPNLGGDVAKLKQYMSTEADLLDEDREGLDTVATNMQSTQEMIADNLSVATKLDAQMEEAIRTMVNALGGEQGLIELTNVLVGVIKFFSNNITLFSTLMMGMALGKFGVGASAIGTLVGMGAAADFAGSTEKSEEERMQKERDEKYPKGKLSSPSSSASGKGLPGSPGKSLESSMADALPGGTTRGLSSRQSRALTMNQASSGTNTAKSSAFVGAEVVHTTDSRSSFRDKGSATPIGPVMATPAIARDYKTPVFDKNDVFYAAKADGVLASMLKDITQVVAEIAAKNSTLKLSMSERDAGRMAADGLNAIKRL